MPKLVALDLTNGQELFAAIAAIRDQGDAFCVLDPRDSATRRRVVLDALAPTHIQNHEGRRELSEGRATQDGDGAVVLTSGSSGQPKAAVLTWDALQHSATLTTEALRRRATPRWWVNLTPVHIGGLAVYLRCLFTESEPVFATSRDEALAQGATHVSLVRTQLARDDYSDFEVVLLGGGPAPFAVPANVVTTYGMTETGSGIVYDGRPLRDVELRIIEGEIHVSAPTLLRCYRDEHDPTYLVSDGRRWLATGDSGVIDGGQLSVKGRLRYVITTGGEKVWPEDVEQILHAHFGRDDLAVIGVPDEEWGQRLLLVCTESLAESSVFTDAQNVLREAIGRWAVPKELRVIREIPRTSNGKVARQSLAEQMA